MATLRWRTRTTRTVAVLALVLGGGIASALVTVVSEPTVTAVAAAYATLTFPLHGDGAYRFDVEPPEGWLAVTRGGDLVLTGEGFISVTVRVPTHAPAGERFVTTVRIFENDLAVTTATGIVEVGRRTKVGLQGPEALVGAMGAPLAFDVVIVNEGNVPDTIVLSARHTHWDVTFDSAETPLDPGEQRVVGVTLRPTTIVNTGYRHIFQIAAGSATDPQIGTVHEITSRFYPGGRVTGAAGGDRPRITLHVGATASAGVETEAGAVTTSASYSVRPALDGQLSDYVDGSAHTNPLAGNLADPFEEIPSSFTLSLDGPSWDGSLRASGNGYALDVGADLDDWRVSGGGTLSPGESLGASARIDNPRIGLQVWARTGLQGVRRTDTVAAAYRTNLMPELELNVGTGVSGFANPDDVDPYQVALAVSQRLAWQTDGFDVAQSYAGVPLAGVHTLGLTGGTRELYPFGVRARTSYSGSPVSERWSTSLSLYGAPVPGLTMDVTGATTVDAFGARSGVTWSISPRMGYRLRLGEALTTSFAARYGHGGVISGAGTVWDRYEAGVQVGHQSFRLAGAGRYEVRREGGTDESEVSLEASARADLGLGTDALLFASYGYDQNTAPVDRVRHEVGVGWDHAWSHTVASRVQYQRTFDLVGSAGREGVNVGLGVDDVLLPNLRLNAGYTVSSPTSLLDFDTAYLHDLRVGVGYDLPIVFDTPDPLIDLFGGRRGGEVHGVAFLDEDLDGELDVGEPPLTGLTIRVGSEHVTTDDAGAYRLRVPEGAYEFEFTAGLPATVDLRGERGVSVVENEVHERLLPFAPVVSIAVVLFDDRDQNGVQGEAESGIPFGGVVLDGPERRLARTDATGQAIVAGLIPGVYAISVSVDHLPAGYRATGESIPLTLRAGERPAPVSLGAARPPRNVVRTYTGGTLAVLPRALQAKVARGAEVDIEALVQGDVERLLLVHGDDAVPFERNGDRWRVRIRIPRETPIGPLTMSVHAEAGEQRVERPVLVTVVDRPPFVASSIVAAVNEVVQVAIETQFRAGEAALTMPDGQMLTLVSVDGYRWTATWRAPEEGGRFRAALHVDGEHLGEVAVSVFAPPTGEDEACAPSERPEGTDEEEADGCRA